MQKVIFYKRIISFLFIFISLISELYCKDLQFAENGKFVIAHITDLHTKNLVYIRPDLVILGGDLCTGALEKKEMEIHELCELFRSSGTYFTLTSGNHDSESGLTNEKLLALYQKYGGEYCKCKTSQKFS